MGSSRRPSRSIKRHLKLPRVKTWGQTSNAPWQLLSNLWTTTASQFSYWLQSQPTTSTMPATVWPCSGFTPILQCSRSWRQSTPKPLSTSKTLWRSSRDKTILSTGIIYSSLLHICSLEWRTSRNYQRKYKIWMSMEWGLKSCTVSVSWPSTATFANFSANKKYKRCAMKSLKSKGDLT